MGRRRDSDGDYDPRKDRAEKVMGRPDSDTNLSGVGSRKPTGGKPGFKKKAVKK